MRRREVSEERGRLHNLYASSMVKLSLKKLRFKIDDNLLDLKIWGRSCSVVGILINWKQRCCLRLVEILTPIALLPVAVEWLFPCR